MRNSRISIITFAIFFFSFVLVAKLFFIQVISHSKYRALAEAQYWNTQELPAKRGEILSSDGFTLATNSVSYLLFAEPKQIKNPDEFIEELALAYPLTDEIRKNISLGLSWVILRRGLSLDEKKNIEALKIEGIGFEEEPVRFYPERSLASHLLGFVAGNEKGEKQGYFGVEGYFDRDLRGRAGRIIEERDAYGRSILAGSYRKIKPVDGRKIVLTINRAIQYIVERRLKEGVEEFGAVSGSVVVMDPASGDILAMANYPDYYPAEFDKSIESTSSKDIHEPQRINYAISEVYEPGSAIKGLTISAAVDLNKVKPETTFVDAGPVTYSGYKIDNWNGKHFGEQTIVQLLQKSNNIGAVWVGHLIGAKSLSEYFLKFGLGSKTGVDLEGEDTGVIRSHNEWTDIDLATAAFGQGVSATPLQVLNAFNVIANGGDLLKPRIVSRLIDDGKVIEIPVKKVKSVISKRTSDTMINLLSQAVSGGESKFYNLKSHDIAGKTGTAQIPIDGKYDPQKTNATFVGFLTKSKKFSMIVKLNQPTSSVYAAETAVPLWMQISQDLINHFGIPPDF